MRVRECLREPVRDRGQHQRGTDGDAEHATELTGEVDQPGRHAHARKVDGVLGRERGGDEAEAHADADAHHGDAHVELRRVDADPGQEGRAQQQEREGRHAHPPIADPEHDRCADRRTDHQGQHHRREDPPGVGGRRLQYHDHEERQERDDREHHHPERHADDARGPQRGTRKRLSGINGSVARRSATTNATNSTTLVARAPTMTGEPHA